MSILQKKSTWPWRNPQPAHKSEVPRDMRTPDTDTDTDTRDNWKKSVYMYI